MLAAERSGMYLVKLLEPGSEIPISERERMVFSIINADTPPKKHVTLTEILDEDEGHGLLGELQNKSFDTAQRVISSRKSHETPISIGTKRHELSSRRSSHILLERSWRSHVEPTKSPPVVTRSKAQEALMMKYKQVKKKRGQSKKPLRNVKANVQK
mmetsp:Transcript_25638/g.44865  ORF Transcript_25638/g.44865 Transcript_25638/m.44865 type:complete len:157 (+) Transcript_25638:64-534(+)